MNICNWYADLQTFPYFLDERVIGGILINSVEFIAACRVPLNMTGRNMKKLSRDQAESLIIRYQPVKSDLVYLHKEIHIRIAMENGNVLLCEFAPEKGEKKYFLLN